MPPTTTEHRRAHNLLLINNLLSQTTTSSPFTLVQDSLEQSARPLVREYIRRAIDAKVKIVFVSFETLSQPEGVTTFIQAWDHSVAVWQKQVLAAIADRKHRVLLVFDNLNVASTVASSHLPAILSSLITPIVSLLAVYHTDIPDSNSTISNYQPTALSLLTYLATTVLTTHSLQHVIAKKAARDRSVAEPSFGIDEGIDGVLQGLGANSPEAIVIEMEHRRKSGRGIKEWYVLRYGEASRHSLHLLEEYPGYRTESLGASTSEEVTSTFELGLTERQRQDRQGVVLPYFDAQKGSDEGGRILYDMGSEDDFDEEEDEI